MGRRTILLSFFIMPFIVSTYAQKAGGNAMRWKIAAHLPSLNGRAGSLGFAGPVAGVHENKLIIAGGANFPDNMPWEGGKKKYYDDAYVYRKKKNKLVLQKIVKLPFAVAYSANCSTPNGIVYAGGENEKGISDKVFLLQWDAFSTSIVMNELSALPVAVTNAASVFYENVLYIAGGETADGATDQFHYLDMNNTAAGWKLLPAVPKPLSHAVMLASSNNDRGGIYIIGGRRKNTNGISDLYSSVFRFDILENRWEEMRSLPYALSAGTGAVLKSNHILLFGGDRGETFHKTETLIAAIHAEKDESKKSVLIQQKNKLQTSHPGFSKEILMYNAESDEWVATGFIPFDTPVTTTAVIWENKVMIPSGELRAGVRTPQILSVNLYPKDE